MALASYGEPTVPRRCCASWCAPTATAASASTGSTGPRWPRPRPADGEMTEEHADLAASVQARLEEVLLDLAGWLHEAAGGPRTWPWPAASR